MRRQAHRRPLGWWAWWIVIPIAVAHYLLPLVITVSPHWLMRGDQVHVHISVQPNDANRLLRVEVDGPERIAWEISMEGERAPIAYDRWLPTHLSPGEYRVTVRVLRAAPARPLTAIETFTVLGGTE